jgi:surface protein
MTAPTNKNNLFCLPQTMKNNKMRLRNACKSSITLAVTLLFSPFLTAAEVLCPNNRTFNNCCEDCGSSFTYTNDLRQAVQDFIEDAFTATKNYGLMNCWDVSKITDMSNIFSTEAYYNDFNEPIECWNVSSVTNMSSMFYGRGSFNQPLDKWNVGRVTDMSAMFSKCYDFNQPFDKWNVGRVTDMSAMFYGCSSFNQPLDDWDFSHVTDMSAMFSGCSSFIQTLDKWNVSHITDMSAMT